MTKPTKHFGLATRPPMRNALYMPTIITHEELTRLVRKALPAPIQRFQVFYCDLNYVLMDDHSCASTMLLLSQEVQKIIGPWRSEYRNCNKFGRLFQALGAASHARGWIESKKTPNGGLALGTLSYRTDSGEGHMIVLTLTKVRGKNQIKVRTFEPQNGEEVFLSETEKKQGVFNLFI